MESSADADTYVPMNNNHGNQPDVPDFYQEMKSRDRIKCKKNQIEKEIKASAHCAPRIVRCQNFKID